MSDTAWPIEIHEGTDPTGVVMVHDIMGLDEGNRTLARELNAEGFWVATVDLYRGRTATDLEGAMDLRRTLTQDDLAEAMTEARSELRRAGPEGPIGSMGFCMGGGVALEGACRAPYDFCVDYYGSIQDVSAVANLQGPVLLILASEDDRINPWAYEELLPALDEHDKRATVQLYPGVGHAFHRPDWPERHDEASAADAWARAVAFMRESASGD